MITGDDGGDDAPVAPEQPGPVGDGSGRHNSRGIIRLIKTENVNKLQRGNREGFTPGRSGPARRRNPRIPMKTTSSSPGRVPKISCSGGITIELFLPKSTHRVVAPLLFERLSNMDQFSFAARLFALRVLVQVAPPPLLQAAFDRVRIQAGPLLRRREQIKRRKKPQKERPRARSPVCAPSSPLCRWLCSLAAAAAAEIRVVATELRRRGSKDEEPILYKQIK